MKEGLIDVRRDYVQMHKAQEIVAGRGDNLNSSKGAGKGVTC